MKKTVCIMFGGRSSEYEVSLHSASSVLRNIDRDKYDIVTVGVTKDGQWYIFNGSADEVENGSWINDKEKNIRVAVSPSYKNFGFVTEKGDFVKVDVIFPVMHGANCEDGTLQGLFELSGVKFVGPGCAASAVSMDKSVTKAVLNSYNVLQAKSVTVTENSLKNEFDLISKEVDALSYPVFVKPASAGSSVGVCKVHEREQLFGALKNSIVYGGKVLVEEYVKGKEIEVAVMGNDEPVASCPGEIDPGAEFYDYDTKYVSNVASLYIPARLDAEVSQKIRDIAVRIYKLIGCKGLSRVDFFVKEDNTIVFNEINTMPGFTSISMFPKLFVHSGLSYTELITKLIELAEE
ncbi:MAG: D-alanine--D-alanine ligase [Clostridia bacterium]|nr:D-alanine--D-alanine ligase [Clostridia bacterium]